VAAEEPLEEPLQWGINEIWKNWNRYW
jgi:hypothetical protein